MLRSPRFRLIALLVGLSIPGLLSLLLMLPALLKELPPEAPPYSVMVAIALVQVLIMVALAATLGTYLAPRTGLKVPALTAWLAGEQPGLVLKHQLRAGLPIGIAFGALLILADLLLFQGQIPAELGLGLRPASLLELIAGLLYGGIIEEILVRWGLMVLLVWLASFLFKGQDGEAHPVALWFGIAGAALLFGAGHLPAVQALVGEITPVLLVRTIVLNGLPGMLFGWLFARRGLESAIFAHMGAHIGMFILRLFA